MKTKLIIACFLLIATAFIYIYSDTEGTGLSTLALENIEALADDEYDATYRCLGYGSVDCPFNETKVEYVMGGYSLERPW
ncbi:NVEALA domain-containing protein [uncultured Bacteroides sp.]|uniref:NVEALA domain-containing protein n=1 Tax=uncultured Bacteroides sp. TaxID=162156 RepID=UPI002601382D|nr:NVEALA domain-containing protein [uncultured Bacteroides sp.]